MRNSAICKVAGLAGTTDRSEVSLAAIDVAGFLGAEWVTSLSTEATERSLHSPFELLKSLSIEESETCFSAAGGRDYGEQFALPKCAGRSRRRTWIES
jgi:hypothetical protein